MNNLNPSLNLAARPRAGCFPVLFLLAGWLVMIMPLHVDNPPTYLFEIDGSAVLGGFHPYTEALDSSKNVYVADHYSNRVEKFTGNGTYLT
jgi:hypothetical protein